MQVPRARVFTVKGPPETVASAQIVGVLMLRVSAPLPDPPAVLTVKVAAGASKNCRVLVEAVAVRPTAWFALLIVKLVVTVFELSQPLPPSL